MGDLFDLGLDVLLRFLLVVEEGLQSYRRFYLERWPIVKFNEFSLLIRQSTYLDRKICVVEQRPHHQIHGLHQNVLLTEGEFGEVV